MYKGHYRAAICRRGHEIDSMVEPAAGRPDPLPERCPKCGAKVLTACPSCGTPIRGLARGTVYFEWQPEEFCVKCGTPMPWASREAISLHIENLLDEQPDLAEGDRRVLQEQLATLRETPDAVNEKRQVAALARLQAVAPKAWELAVPVLQVILTAEARRQLGLPPG